MKSIFMMRLSIAKFQVFQFPHYYIIINKRKKFKFKDKLKAILNFLDCQKIQLILIKLIFYQLKNILKKRYKNKIMKYISIIDLGINNIRSSRYIKLFLALRQ